MLILYPLAVPIGKLLDRVLGDEIGTIHNRSQVTCLTLPA
jgi:hypothetical protein